MPLYTFKCVKCSATKDHIIPKYFENEEDARIYARDHKIDVCTECKCQMEWDVWSGGRSIRINFAPL